MAPKFRNDISIGASFENRLGEEVIIESFSSCRSIFIRWAGGNVSKTSSHQLRHGSFKNPTSPSVYGIGFLGDGPYRPKGAEGVTREYSAWSGMLQRSYDEKIHERHPTYKDVEVCESWHNFQVFAEWYTRQLPSNFSATWHLDKDLKRSKIYSPETCVLIPGEINTCLVKGGARRGELPIGVSYRTEMRKYRARCHDGLGAAKNLGHYDTPEEAFFAYKTFKEGWLKSLAEKYKDSLTGAAYEAILNYRVMITD